MNIEDIRRKERKNIKDIGSKKDGLLAVKSLLENSKQRLEKNGVNHQEIDNSFDEKIKKGK